MTLKQLYRLNPLKIELEHERIRKYKLIAASKSIGSSISATPRGTGIAKKVENYAIKIHDTSIHICKIEQEIREIKQYIDNVQDSYIRAILKLKIEDNMTYWQIAQRMGGKNTKDSIRMRLKRFLGEN